MNITLKEWLTEKLKDKQMSIAKLAYETGLSRTILYYYLEDTNRPTRNNMEKICSVLGADIEEGMKLFSPKKVGRPKGSVKKWGQETILNKNKDISTPESTLSTERYII